MTSATEQTHVGSCHCGAVRFEARVDAATGSACNCTVCTKVNAVVAMLKPDAFRLLSGEDSLTAYEWGGRTAQRYFCKVCGISCFSRGSLPELGGEYVCISLNALDDVDPAAVEVGYWDGRHDNWQAGLRDSPWPINA